MDGKLFLIDGHSLIFRMYYAFLRRPMVNSKGEDVSILYGFTRYVLELMAKYAPTHVAVCFDPPGKTFRHQLFPEYKGTRQATPELVIAALEPLIEICKAMEMPVLMMPGFEGDDVLGAMALRSAAQGMEVYMVTPDKDFGQLISDRIFQLKPGKSGGDDEIVGPAQLCAKYGIKSPSQVIDMLAICGDSADNVPGVAGVGEVGAGKLIAQYGSVENIYAHLDELTPRQQELFRAAEGHIALSKTLVTIKTDIDIDVTADDMRRVEAYSGDVARLIERYEFPSLKKMLPIRQGEVVTSSTQPEASNPIVKDVAPEQLTAAAKSAGMVGVVVDYEQDGAVDGAKVSRLTLSVMPTGVTSISESAVTGSAAANSQATDGLFAVADDNAAARPECLVSTGTSSDFEAILSDTSIVKTGYDLKTLFGYLNTCGIALEGRMDDISLLHYLVNPEQSHKVEVLARSYLGFNVEQESAQEKSEGEDNGGMLGLFDQECGDGTEGESGDGAGRGAWSNPLKDRRLEAAAVFMLNAKLREQLRERGMEELFDRIEEPLQRVLSRMESAGVKVDMTPLNEYAASLREEMVTIENKVRTSLEEPQLNLSSPRQVGVALFEKLRIDPRKKLDPKHVYPTDEETLMNYAEEFPVIYDILEFRGIKKLLGTYIEPFAEWISPRDGRIHTTFNQALTATGRLSSSRPNLQNIPVRTERGREIRKAFVAGESDKVIVSADYSQIELRLMAHFCGDEHMREAFSQGLDVHSITASKIYHVPLEEVTADMRRAAKTANFGIMYGISAFGLAQRLKMPRVAAKKLIEDYFESFPSIRNWIDSTVASAEQNGYVQTLFGRRRYLPDINSRNATARALAARNAVNAPIQGTAADIIKIAMVNVDRRLREEGMETKMVLQIHDELVFESPRGEVDKLSAIIKNEMENVLELSVPLTIECNYGNNWLEAH